MSPDPRLTLRLDDLADARLEGIFPAAVYRTALGFRVRAPRAAIRNQPDPQAEQVSELLLGERFHRLEAVDGFSFGQCGRDGYVGYVASEALAPLADQPLSRPYRVAHLTTFAFRDPSIKAPALGPFALNSRVEVRVEEDRFLYAPEVGYFVADHLAPLGQFERDPAKVAERFLHTPYLWGGSSALGVDCSGLVQQALRACGIACPRDSDQQQALGRELELDEDALQRGDLVFWRGHVAMMLDDKNMVHANAHHMAVTIEPLQTAVARIAADQGHRPVRYRRLAI